MSGNQQLLGVTVDLLTIDQLNFQIKKIIKEDGKVIIANHNLHSIYLFHKNKFMRDFYKKSVLTHVDGMSLVLLGRLLRKPFKKEHRVTYVDWIHPLMRQANDQQLKVFFIGSRHGVAEKAAIRLRNQYKNLKIETHHGYFSTEDDTSEVLRAVSKYRPHILMVGMGMPRQEMWILEHYDQLEANIILTAGACMDYIAGAIPTPPRWMGQFGLEWLFRLFSEPKRLWKRYLVEPWFLLILLAKDIIKK